MASNKRNLILILLIIIAIGLIAFQLYELYSKDNTVSIPPIENQLQHAPQQLHHILPNNAVPVTDHKASQPPAAKDLPAPKQMTTPTPENGTTPHIYNKEQAAYLKMSNKYQLLKMKRLLIDEELAIATAKQKITTINSQLGESDLGVEDIDNLDSFSNQSSIKKHYRLAYLDQQKGNWSATLSQHGNFLEVKNGTKLPDGTVVVNINSRGVTLKNHDQYEKLTFSGITKIMMPAVLKPAVHEVKSRHRKLNQSQVTKKSVKIAAKIHPHTTPQRILSKVKMPPQYKEQALDPIKLQKKINSAEQDVLSLTPAEQKTYHELEGKMLKE